MRNTDQKQQAATHPPSDGSELIPAEVQANMREEVSQSQHEPLPSGYTVDDEGIVNNYYAIGTEIFKAAYPSASQQRRYLWLGAAAILFVALAVWIAVAVS